MMNIFLISLFGLLLVFGLEIAYSKYSRRAKWNQKKKKKIDTPSKVKGKS